MATKKTTITFGELTGAKWNALGQLYGSKSQAFAVAISLLYDRDRVHLQELGIAPDLDETEPTTN